jgi:hypothetical protein
MFIPPAAAAIDFQPVIEWASRASVALVAIWSQLRSAKVPEADPIEDLTYRLRHPLKWSAAHPLKAIRRKITG